MALATAQAMEEDPATEVDLADELLLARALAARCLAAMKDEPVSPENALSAALAVLDRVQRLVEAQRKIKESRAAGMRPFHENHGGEDIDAEDLTPAEQQRLAIEELCDRVRTQAQMWDLWPDSTVERFCEVLAETVGGVGHHGE